MADGALEDGVFEGERHEFVGTGGGVDGLAPGAHGLKGGGEVDLLEGAGAEYCGADLAGQGEDGGAVHFGVPEAREKVGRAGAGDGEAGGGVATELGVGRGGEGGGGFVADADVGEVAEALLASHGVGETEVGVTNDAEDVADAPVDHGFDHDVGIGAGEGLRFGEGDVDTVVTDVDGIARGAVAEAAGRFAGEGVVVEAVPGAAEPALFDGALAERAALVGAEIVEGAVATVEVGKGDGFAADGDGGDAPVGQFVEADGAVPGGSFWFGDHGYPPVARVERAPIVPSTHVCSSNGRGWSRRQSGEFAVANRSWLRWSNGEGSVERSELLLGGLGSTEPVFGEAGDGVRGSGGWRGGRLSICVVLHVHAVLRECGRLGRSRGIGRW